MFQRRAAGRGQANGLVLAGGADVVQLLGLHRIDVQVVPARVLADDHALIGLFAGADEHDAAVFQVPQGEGGGFTVRVRDQHARAARVGQELALIADQRTRRAFQLDAGLAYYTGTKWSIIYPAE